MNKSNLKRYAAQARKDFIQAVSDRAHRLGIAENHVEPAEEKGDVTIIAGQAFPTADVNGRGLLVDEMERRGFQRVVEEAAYTWFNRFAALRFMEIHSYFDHGFRVLSSSNGSSSPELLERAADVSLPGLRREVVVELKLAGNKDAELYRLLLLAQCHDLAEALGFLFERDGDGFTDLLLPDNLLLSDSVLRKMVEEIEEEDWQEVEIIGWLYQFFISERKGEVIGNVVKSEDIPAATQLFTPNWIVKYMVQNSLGRLWLEAYPDSGIRKKMDYYIEPAEQTPEVQAELEKIRPKDLKPEDITLIDPACGSGHILVEAFDLLFEIYTERGYRQRDIPGLILQHNLYGLDIDKRAAQLAGFALMMEARKFDRQVFTRGVAIHVHEIHESNNLDLPSLQLGRINPQDAKELLDIFKDAKTYGSLISIPESLALKLPSIREQLAANEKTQGLFVEGTVKRLLPLLEVADVLVRKYDCVVMNPPYMGGRNGMEPALKGFVESRYPLSKSNLCVVFIEKARDLLSPGGLGGMITLQSWMFLPSYQSFREHFLQNYGMPLLAQLGARAFSEISGEVVQTASFILRRMETCCKPVFIRLVDGDEEDKARNLPDVKFRFTKYAINDLLRLPGCPFVYWLPESIMRSFLKQCSLKDIVETREGMATADNDRFLRYWHEVSIRNICFGAESSEAAAESRLKWFPYIKGGEYRKWYGNHEYVVNWQNDGEAIRAFRDEKTGRIRSHNYNGEYAFRIGFTWSSISSEDMAVRLVDKGFLFDAKGPMGFAENEQSSAFVVAYLNSRLGAELMKALAPTLDYKLTHVLSLPVDGALQESTEIGTLTRECVEIAKRDWDSIETSWGFTESWQMCGNRETVASSWEGYELGQQEVRMRLARLETRVNELFVAAYEVSDAVRTQVETQELTIGEPSKELSVSSLLMYSVGCMMGRYSLDKPGLIYAHAGNEGFAPSQYVTFPADDDGIIPLTDMPWFEDDATERFVQFIATAWPKEHLDENLKWIAESLGTKGNETPRETIRRYFTTSFYKFHCQMYKNRPIYWLFSSGKQKAFEALVYLHRYNEQTLSRMRAEYVVPLMGKFAARMENIQREAEAASSTSAQKKAQKELEAMKKKHLELQKFDEELRHYADQRISLDLDDGVAVNYQKFGNLLAKI